MAASKSAVKPLDRLEPYEATPVDHIDATIDRLQQSFRDGKTRSVDFRLAQLRKLFWAIDDNAGLIAEACARDVGKGPFEVAMTEVGWVKNDIALIEERLVDWLADESPEDMSFQDWLMGPVIRKDPLGTVLIIGAFNFPFQLSICPVVGAIAAGCTVVLKPSEKAGWSSALMASIFANTLDPDCYTVVQGGVEETSRLLNVDVDHRWDKIFFTGGEGVGRIVNAAAAKHLTPVTLELGGLNPAFITKSANVRLAARRLLWAKSFNAGQVCLSQNWVLVDESKMDEFKLELQVAYSEFFPATSPTRWDEYSRMISTAAYDSVMTLLERSSGKRIEMDKSGTKPNREDRFIPPTVIEVSSPSDELVTNETFGPVITIMSVPNLKTAIKHANDVHSTPLAVYPFGSGSEVATILAETRSGGASINDGFFHATIAGLPFGGVGRSGTGSYHGRQSVDGFLHRRAISKTPSWVESQLKVRYPPATPSKLAVLLGTMSRTPRFDRSGNVKFGARLKGAVLSFFARPGWRRYVLVGIVVLVIRARISQLRLL